jgi:hypothetical protein
LSAPLVGLPVYPQVSDARFVVLVWRPSSRAQ